MDFYHVVDQVIELLRTRGRVSYRALQRQFDIDEAYLEDLKNEIIDAQRLAIDEGGKVLVWTGEPPKNPAQAEEQREPFVASKASPAAPSPTPDSSSLPPRTVQDEPPRVVVSGAPPIPEAERRQLTVLFCALVGSTDLSGRLDPEDLRKVMRAYQGACDAVIQSYDGYIAQYLGDGLLVYFGYPQAHEDDAQRAVRAGLGIVEATTELNSRFKQDENIRLAVRVGIHTGLVVVGEVGGSSKQELLALGETPNVAARLQGIAAPDTVAISAVTARLIQGYFTCEDLGAHILKGVADPMAVSRVIGESTARSRLDASITTELTPLVGHESEVTLLLERWAQTLDGMGQVALLSGEAGIGKSRLVEVLRVQAAEEDATRIIFRSSPYHTNSTFYPVIEHLLRFLRFQRDDTPESINAG